MTQKKRRERSVGWRSTAVLAFDMALAFGSVMVAFWLRLGWAEFSDLSFRAPADMLLIGLAFAAVSGFVFWINRLHRHVWRYVSVDDLVAIVRAATLAVIVFIPAVFLIARLDAVPRSVPVITWLVLIFALGGSRLAVRISKVRGFGVFGALSPSDGVRVLVAGAGDEAEQYVRATLRDPSRETRVVGLVSSHQARVGSVIQGIEVMGGIGDLEGVFAKLAARGQWPERIVIANSEFAGSQVRSILDQATALNCPVARLPKPTELKDATAEPVTPRAIKIEDLLGRPERSHDRKTVLNLLKDKRVLVTGAGGSIGSELVRQVAKAGPASLTLLDHSEFNLYTIDTEMADNHPSLDVTALLADVRDAARLDRVFQEAKPDLVFHAAALKHVPLVEFNVAEGVRTNAFGTANVAAACQAHDVDAMVFVSTDKAVNPTNVMGATKRIAEMIVQTEDVRSPHTRFITVRFGNVLGSTGSVVPRFASQIEAGGPITVTHPDVTRYFMTIPEAVELVLQASALGRAQKADGRVYILDMGEPIKIMDLAKQLVRLSGKEPGRDIEIKITGMRPGEKLHEEVHYGDEPPEPTPLDGIVEARPRPLSADLLAARMRALAEACESDDEVAVRAALKSLVPELSDGQELHLKLIQST